MNRLGLSGLFIVLAVGLTGAQSPARLVEIQVTLPGGGHPVLKVHEGETASVTMPGNGTFGFVPTIKAGDSTTLVVDVLDLTKTPPEKLTTLETSLHMPAVPTNTKPQMAVKATYILEAGPPPIVLTPGSANRHAAAFFRAALGATSQIGQRAVCVTAHADHLPAPLPDGALHASYAPFATLFPRAAAVVHHGGIGTSAQALAAGVPQLIVPMGFDQPDNAVRLVQLGVGAAIPARRVTGPRAAAALRALLTGTRTQSACRRWREAMDSEAAIRRACDLIEEQFRRATGQAATGPNSQPGSP